MVATIIYGFTVGAILYFFSIGLSLTFGAMRIINFAHAMVYAMGVYLFIAFLAWLQNMFALALLCSLAAMIPVAWAIERLVIRRLYGEGLDYAMIATYGVLLIGTDIIKLVWGGNPQPVNEPIHVSLSIAGIGVPVYRIMVVAAAVALYQALRVFFSRSVIGRVVVAALEDSEGVRCLGLDVNRYFSIVFILGSELAVLGGILYAPIASAEPYMGFQILLLAFAVVIVGGMGNLSGTFWAAMLLGMVMAITGRFWSQASNAMVFVVMAAVLIFRPVESTQEGR
jgi:branched-subunit amino acid ABC-type transport system permease component